MKEDEKKSKGRRWKYAEKASDSGAPILAVRLPPELLVAIKNRGGSSWVRSLIEKEIAPRMLTAEEKNQLAGKLGMTEDWNGLTLTQQLDLFRTPPLLAKLDEHGVPIGPPLAEWHNQLKEMVRKRFPKEVSHYSWYGAQLHRHIGLQPNEAIFLDSMQTPQFLKQSSTVVGDSVEFMFTLESPRPDASQPYCWKVHSSEKVINDRRLIDDLIDLGDKGAIRDFGLKHVAPLLTRHIPGVYSLAGSRCFYRLVEELSEPSTLKISNP